MAGSLGLCTLNRYWHTWTKADRLQTEWTGHSKSKKLNVGKNSTHLKPFLSNTHSIGLQFPSLHLQKNSRRIQYFPSVNTEWSSIVAQRVKILSFTTNAMHSLWTTGRKKRKTSYKECYWGNLNTDLVLDNSVAAMINFPSMKTVKCMTWGCRS